jgi:hypothetical protein
LKTSVEIERIKAKSRDSLSTHIKNTVSGTTQIRVSQSDNFFQEKFHSILDNHTKASTSKINVENWFAIRLGLHIFVDIIF